MIPELFHRPISRQAPWSSKWTNSDTANMAAQTSITAYCYSLLPDRRVYWMRSSPTSKFCWTSVAVFLTGPTLSNVELSFQRYGTGKNGWSTGLGQSEFCGRRWSRVSLRRCWLASHRESSAIFFLNTFKWVISPKSRWKKSHKQFPIE